MTPMIAPEQRQLDHARPEVDVVGQQQQVVEERARRRAVEDGRGDERAADPGPEGEQVEHRHHQRQGDDPRQDEVADRVDPEHLERLELLADLAGADLGGDRRAERAGDDRRRQQRAELAQEGDGRDGGDPVDRAERRGQRAALDPDRREADDEGDDARRAEGDPEREDELAHELAAPGEARADELADSRSASAAIPPAFSSHSRGGTSGRRRTSRAPPTRRAAPPSADPLILEASIPEPSDSRT